MLSIAIPGLAAGNHVGAPPPAEVNQNIEALLKRVEQEIYANHTMSPAGDSAIDAWMQVIQVIPATDSVRVGNALRTFAIHMHSCADEVKKAGNLAVSEDLSLFASVAEGQMARVTAKTDLAEKPPSGVAVSNPPEFEPLGVPVSPIVAPNLRVSKARAAPANRTVQANAEPEARPQAHPRRRRVRATNESSGLGRFY